MRKLITDIPLDGFSDLATDLGLKSYVADEIISWLYKRRASSFGEMTNLSREARKKLGERFEIESVASADAEAAPDGTRKFLCRLRDGEAVECVLIPAENRATACLSTQVGCAMGCTFCRTSSMGLRRNLTAGEIVGQLIIMMRDGDVEISNVVLMGMGEPLANFDAVSDAIGMICDGRAFGFGKRRVTLSTAGLIPELERLSGEHGIKIAISLNATTDDVRNRLMPINRRYPIARIMEFSRAYSRRSRYRVTFEYVMIRSVNDSREDATRLVRLLKGVRAKVNLIPFNPFDGCPFEASDTSTVELWSSFLHERGVQTNVRVSRGQEILAACGQLATISRNAAEQAIRSGRPRP